MTRRKIMSTDALAPATTRDRGRNISFVADVFEKSVQWVRWGESNGKFKRADGTYIIPRRTNPARATAGFRKYTLHDIHEMIESARREQLIDLEKYEKFMNKLNAWGYTDVQQDVA
jgi:hypothetical protein